MVGRGVCGGGGGNHYFQCVCFYTLFSMVQRMGGFINYRKTVKGQRAGRQTGKQVDTQRNITKSKAYKHPAESVWGNRGSQLQFPAELYLQG